jgi:hypothetical protein
MVAGGTPRGARRGASSLGCLVMLVLLGAAVYYGGHVGMVYFRYYEIRDDMQQQARFADQLGDAAMQRTLAAQADSLLGQAPTFQIHRGGRPNRITIQTEYTERVDLPLFKRTFVLRPRVEAPL